MLSVEESIKLYPHQEQVLEQIKGRKRVLLALSMGLGKSICASEHLKTLSYESCLIICPKSLIGMWIGHYKKFYNQEINDYTKTKKIIKGINIVNYDLVFRRADLLNLHNITLILDECTAISNPTAKRTKAIMGLNFDNLIMLSGSVSKGKYENLYTISKMLGIDITKKEFYNRYIIEKEIKINNAPFPIKIIVGYKNQEELRESLRRNGTIFMKTEEAIRLPEQTFIDLSINTSKEYKTFLKDRIIVLKDGTEIVGENSLTNLLGQRKLCGVYSKEKIDLVKDLIDSTDDRIIIFYNFWDEFHLLKSIIDRPISVVNGKERDLNNYEQYDNSVCLIQYTAGSSGLNLQEANKIIYFSPTLSADEYMQSQKRIHRIGQQKACFYYRLVCGIDEKIYKALKRGEDYTNYLFEKGE